MSSLVLSLSLRLTHGLTNLKKKSLIYTGNKVNQKKQVRKKWGKLAFLAINNWKGGIYLKSHSNLQHFHLPSPLFLYLSHTNIGWHYYDLYHNEGLHLGLLVGKETTNTGEKIKGLKIYLQHKILLKGWIIAFHRHGCWLYVLQLEGDVRVEFIWRRGREYKLIISSFFFSSLISFLWIVDSFDANGDY